MRGGKIILKAQMYIERVIGCYTILYYKLETFKVTDLF